MSINEIKLAPSQLPDWYGHQLVSTESTENTATQKTRPTLLGDYNKRILIVVNAPNHAFLADEELALLTGILTACKLSMADIGILNLSPDLEWSAADLADTLKPSAWWLFGTEQRILGSGATTQVGLTTSLQGAPVFVAPSLNQLAERPEAKRSLWSALKTHYGV